MFGKLCNFITKYMAAIVLLAALAAFLFPVTFGHVKTSLITPMLGFVMFGMGLSLDMKAFALIFTRPREIIAGLVCQYTIMPLLALLLSSIFSLPAELAVGVILVGCCPGGTSSNVITYLSKGDLALSIGMTSVSTILAPVMTPFLVKLLAGVFVPVDFWGMFFSIIEVIILPVALGFIVRKLFPSFVKTATAYLPAFSTVVITLIVIAVIAANSASLHGCGLLVILVVILHNLFGYALGYASAKLLKLPFKKAVSVSVEVGMQNSGLACSLAANHFNVLALASVPGAVFSVWHNISGALLAGFFSRCQRQGCKSIATDEKREY